MRGNYFFSVYLTILLLSSGMAMAQVASISGTVSDETGAVLPGATVQATNLDTGAIRNSLSDDEGRYRIREVSLGTYRVEASLPGFQKVVRDGIVLTLGRAAIVNVQLPVGEITEEVMVTGDAPLVETTSSGMEALVSREQIHDLPLNSRDFSQLVTLQAGTARFRHEAGSPVSGFGARISVSGARPTMNSFVLDGTDVNTPTGVMPSGVSGASLGVEAVREFKVLTSNYSAKQGRAAGANIVAVSRSGTNDFHGSAFEYLRNDNLDATNFFINRSGQEKPEFKRNQFGFSLGGPIVRDRTFFFTTYEGLRENQPLSLTARVPTAEARNGIFPDGDNVVVDPVVKPYLDLWPMPNGLDFGDGTARFDAPSEAQTSDQDYFALRLDNQLNGNHGLFGRYTIENSSRFVPRPIPISTQDSSSRNQYFTLEETGVLSPQVVNVVRLGFSRNTVGVDNDVKVDPSLAFVTGRPFGELIVGSGITQLTGMESNAPRATWLNTYQLYDDVTWDKGRHSLKFGAAGTMFKFNKRSFGRYGAQFNYSNFRDFLEQADPNRVRGMGPEADPHRSWTQFLWSFYLQDDIQLSANLTLNLGLRYEYNTVPTERYGRVANLRDVANDATTTIGDPLWDSPSGDDFAPRVGLAWDPTGSGRFSVRASAGVFMEPILIKQVLNVTDRQRPFWQEFDVRRSAGRGLFPNLDDAFAAGIADGPQATHVVEFELSSPYIIQQSLSLQGLLANDLVAEIAYTGSHGVHLTSRQDLAVPVPSFLPDGSVYYCIASLTTYPDRLCDEDAPLLNPNFSRIEFYGTGASSAYHALKFNVNKRFSDGLHFQSAYTWARSIDEESAHLAGEGGATTVPNAWDIPSNRGLSNFHIAHNFVTNFSYELPLGRGRRVGADWSGVVDNILGGWQISGILNASTGNPVNVNSHQRMTHPLVAQGSIRPDLLPGQENNPILGGPDKYFGTSGFVPQGCKDIDLAVCLANRGSGVYGDLGRNTLIGPDLFIFDFSVLKDFYVNRDNDVKLQFRAEFFNVTNHTNFGLPADNVFDSRGRPDGGAGVIDETVTTSRQIQFALRLDF